ncbi:hypothetical protein [Enorma massiliensis]|uniref:Rod shape-determining protein MreD n=1 Tax=Enorma massiliensis TaxID=1472761 RepID=A0A1Y3U781_9ACTN|nr:hypothetical protein [Enorma massiliensis]OUN44651.1 hypothetical protein B5G21_00175 [Enorma massiliensis]
MDFRDSGPSQRSLVILAVVACVIQVALSPQISIFGGRFNAMLVLAGTLALTGNAPRAVYVGFFAGLFYDLTASVPVGLMTLLLTIGSFALSHVSNAGTTGFSGTSIRLFFVFSIVVCLANGIGLLLLGYEGDILISLGAHGLMSALLSCALAVPFLMVAGSANQGRGGFTAKGKGGTRFKSSSSGKRLRNLR